MNWPKQQENNLREGLSGYFGPYDNLCENENDEIMSAHDRERTEKLRHDLQRMPEELNKLHRGQESLNRLETRLWEKLPYAKGAMFNSYGGDHRTCHPATRVDLLRQIQDWAQQSHSKSIFWLNGGTTIEALVQLLQHPYQNVRSEAADALGRQATLPSTAIEALIQMLQHSGESAYTELVDLISSRQEIRSLVPAFSPSVLQHFVKHWFSTASVICFIEKGCFCVGASEHFQRILMDQHQLERFEVQWQKARDDVGLPSLMPVFSTSVVSRTLSSAHMGP